MFGYQFTIGGGPASSSGRYILFQRASWLVMRPTNGEGVKWSEFEADARVYLMTKTLPFV